mgnify:FL=1
MTVRQIITLKGWIDGSGWTYEQIYDDQSIEIVDVHDIDWDWWETDKENPPNEGGDTQIIIKYYDIDADVEVSEPLAIHRAWASEIWADRYK